MDLEGWKPFLPPRQYKPLVGAALRRPSQAKESLGLDAKAFAEKAAHFLADLNAIHPFREGNGRTQLAFMTALAEQAGHRFALERIDPNAMLDATIESFGGSEKPLATLIRGLIEQA